MPTLARRSWGSDMLHLSRSAMLGDSERSDGNLGDFVASD